jgi:hypothetical protein
MPRLRFVIAGVVLLLIVGVVLTNAVLGRGRRPTGLWATT